MSIRKTTRCEFLKSGFVRGPKVPKQASLSNFDFVPEPGMLYVTARAISSRVNANYDGWPAAELRRAYRSFVGRPVYVDHNNWNTDDSRGVILDSKLHEDRIKTASGEIEDVWVELLIEVDAQVFPKLAQDILSGDIDAVSMGADVEYTICSVCGNKAHDTKEYCAHIPTLKGQKVETTEVINGRTAHIRKLCYETCYGVSFFEISFVFDPADESADVLDKMIAAVGHTGSRRMRRHLRLAHENDEQYRRRVTGISKAANKLADQLVMSLPDEVDTLRTVTPCPQCGSEWDGLVCQNCGYEKPPEDLNDPNIEPDGMTMEVRQQAEDNAELQPEQAEQPVAEDAEGEFKKQNPPTVPNTNEAPNVQPQQGVPPLQQQPVPPEDQQQLTPEQQEELKQKRPFPPQEVPGEQPQQQRFPPAQQPEQLPPEQQPPEKKPPPGQFPPEQRKEEEQEEEGEDKDKKKKLPPWMKKKQKGGVVSRVAEILKKRSEEGDAMPTSLEQRTPEFVDEQTPAAETTVGTDEQVRTEVADQDVQNLDEGVQQGADPASDTNEPSRSEVSVPGDDVTKKEEGGEGPTPPAVESSRYDDIARRAAEARQKRQADEVNRVDVENLDEKTPVNTAPDATADVLKPEDQGPQLEKADTPDTVMDGSETGHPVPPDKKDNPFNDDGKYNPPKSSRTRMVAAFNLVTDREELGISRPEERLKETDRFEEMNPEKFEGYVESTKEFKEARLRVAGQRLTLTAGVKPKDDDADPGQNGTDDGGATPSRLSGRLPHLGSHGVATGGDDERLTEEDQQGMDAAYLLSQ